MATAGLRLVWSKASLSSKRLRVNCEHKPWCSSPNKRTNPSCRPRNRRTKRSKAYAGLVRYRRRIWMNFYTKVLAKYATTGGLKVRVTFEVAPDGGLLPQRIDETKALLRELGLDDNVDRVG